MSSDEDFGFGDDSDGIEIDDFDDGDIVMGDDDSEDIDFEFGEDEGEEDEEQLIENSFYTGKQETDEESIETFQGVIDMSDEYPKWNFKATKQLIKRLYRLHRYAEMIDKFRSLLKFKQPEVSRNESERALNKVMQMVAGSADGAMVNQIYSIALESLEQSGNEKMWFQTKLAQGRQLCRILAWGDDDLIKIIQDLRQWCALPSGREDSRKSSQLLDVLVLQIQRSTALNEFKKLKELYHTCRRIELTEGAVVSNPTISGIIREAGGRMHMREKQWGQAYADFFDAFKSYDEAGNYKRISCLKYLVVVAMLQSAEKGGVINPFTSSEAKPYRDHKEISAMTTLIRAYEGNDINLFENTLKYNRESIEADEFLKGYVTDLLRSIRMRVLLILVKPYTRVRLQYLADELHVDAPLVESLCCDLILDDKLKASIDQIDQLLCMESVNRNIGAKKRYDALKSWTNSLKDVHTAVLNKIEL